MFVGAERPPPVRSHRENLEWPGQKSDLEEKKTAGERKAQGETWLTSGLKGRKSLTRLVRLYLAEHCEVEASVAAVRPLLTLVVLDIEIDC